MGSEMCIRDRANQNYAYVRFPDGREESVSLRHLAPLGSRTEIRTENDPRSEAPENLSATELPATEH